MGRGNGRGGWHSCSFPKELMPPPAQRDPLITDWPGAEDFAEAIVFSSPLFRLECVTARRYSMLQRNARGSHELIHALKLENGAHSSAKVSVSMLLS